MNNLDLEWIEELRQQLSNHILYAPLEDLRVELEPAFQQAMESLPPEKRRDIEQYLRVKQKLDIQLTHMAYGIGLQAGKNSIIRNTADAMFPKFP